MLLKAEAFIRLHTLDKGSYLKENLSGNVNNASLAPPQSGRCYDYPIICCVAPDMAVIEIFIDHNCSDFLIHPGFRRLTNEGKIYLAQCQ